MLFYITYCSVFILATLAVKKDTLKLESEKSEAIFADVIKNISRVNNVLQELINNYEQLQKIYKSQENFDAPEYSSEAEIDRYFKDNKKSNRNKERSFQKYPHGKTTKDYLYATQMILSEVEEGGNNYGKTKTANATTPKIERSQTAENNPINVERKPAAEETTTEKKASLYSEDSLTSTEESKENEGITTKMTTAKTTTTEKTTTKIVEVIKKKPPSEPEIIFIDTHKKIQDKIVKKKPRIMPEIVLEHSSYATKKIKTRYNVKDKPDNKDAKYDLAHPVSYLRNDMNLSKPTSKRFFQVEFLHKKDEGQGRWKEIVMTGKPIQIVNASANTTVNRVESTPTVNLRSHNISNKTAKVFIANDAHKEDSSSAAKTDEEIALTKDLFKTSVLRQAYGDACLKLVVRKCYKACQQAIKSSCRAIKCQSEIRKYFKKSSKKDCDKVFEDAPQLTLRQMNTDPLANIDMTRAGYLSVACLPRADPAKSATSEKKNSDPKNQSKDKELNILRNKYEKACQRTSQEKCNQACAHARNATCVKFECAKNLKRNFRRNCNTQCKIAYVNHRADSGSDSDSDSGSDSESNSESESEDC